MEEGPDQPRAHPDSHHRKPQFALEIREAEGCEVGEFHPLEVTPEPFVRVEFGSVRREVFHPEAVSVLLEELANRDGPMGVEVIPDENYGAVDVSQEVAQENEHLGGSDRPCPDEDEESRVGAHS